MNDSTVSNHENSRQWLLLTHHLPPEPAYFRVKVRRRLERIGAVPLKNSVYVLPAGDETREDFEWLCQEIERNDGEASLSLATFLDPTSEGRLLETFRAARAADFEAIVTAGSDLDSAPRENTDDEAVRAAARARLRSLRRRFDEVVAIDFFDAPGRQAAERALERLQDTARGQRVEPSRDSVGDRPEGRTWVTRAGVKIDRIASAWLIRRFIDPAAAFRFASAGNESAAPGELRFDMYVGEFTHVGDACTFETLLDRFDLGDPALKAIGEIVHDLDIKDDAFGRVETQGVAALIDGLVRTLDDDAERLAQGAILFDALYEHERATL